MPSRHEHRPIKTDLDRFAEAISRTDEEGALSVNEAAIRIGKRPTQGNTYMQRLRKEMGHQAI